MGAPCIDYLIADETLVPAGDRQWYSEQVVLAARQLPGQRQPRARSRRSTPTRAEAGLPGDGFVFCSFNNSYKITPAVFDVVDAAAASRRGQRAVAARGQRRGAAQPAPRGGGARRGRRRGWCSRRACTLAAAPRAAPAGRSVSRHAAVQRAHDGERRAVGGAAGASPASGARSPAASRAACCARRGCPSSSTHSLRRVRGAGAARWRATRGRLAAFAREARAPRGPAARCSTPTASAAHLEAAFDGDVGAAAARRAAGGLRGAGAALTRWPAPAARRRRPRSSSRASR